MKSLLKAFGVAALGALALPAFADDAKDSKDLKKVIEDQSINYVETAQKGITLSGYVDTSYTYQFASKGQYGATAFGGTNSEAQERQFDVNNNNFNINAVKIALEKALPDKNEWAAGFRIDTMYGQDATLLAGTDPTTSSAGIYLEQALVKFRIPVGNGLDIYMGKFVTFLGYEVIESPANLNFSRGLLFTNAIPLTHTGIYADYKFNDTVEAKFGIVDGWNSSISPSVGTTFGPNPDSQRDFGKALTGQLTINAPGKNANITQSFIYSPDGEPGNLVAYPSEFSGAFDNGSVALYDIWGNWNPTFVKDSALLLGFNLDVGYNGAAGVPTPTAPGILRHDSNTWYGLALYSQYKFTKVFSLAGRGEYLHSDEADAPKFGDDFISRGGFANQDDFSYTLTASFNIWDNLLTRVEYRYDHFSPGLSGDATGLGPVSGSTDQHEISLNAVYSF
jgi:opacity protein-like surface antigen